MDKIKNTINTEYLNLLNDKYKFMDDKMKEMNKTIKKMACDNEHLKEHVDLLEDRTKFLSDQIEDIGDAIANDVDDKKCDNDDCDDCSDHRDHKNFNMNSLDGKHIIDIGFAPFNMPNLSSSDKKSKSKHDKNKSKHKSKHNKEDIIIKMNDMGMGMPKNPLDLILGHLKNAMNGKKEEIVPEINSDDEYDPHESIYDDVVESYDDTFIELTDKINSISDIIELGNKFKDEVEKSKSKLLKKKKLELNNKYYELNGKKYGINLDIVIKLSKPLQKLLSMIGIKTVKNDVFDMLIYYLQGFEKNNKSMLHSVVDGPPGVGKTKFGKILAEIYCALGIIPSSKFKYVKATDLIGEHVGATKHMTQNVIDDADGGVLFIDEAYALSSSEKKDPYGKECIDTLTYNLVENKKKLIVIIAGYAEDLDKYVFSYNQGLSRRFPFRFKIEGYNAEELRDIFIDKLRRFRWKFDKSLTMDFITDFFKKNKEEFPNFGGDIENFFKSCQFSHSRRMICKNPIYRTKLTSEDIEAGFAKFKQNKRDVNKKIEYPHMYI
jgi:hypothetical protein